jgi:hypothetical protein
MLSRFVPSAYTVSAPFVRRWFVCVYMTGWCENLNRGDRSLLGAMQLQLSWAGTEHNVSSQYIRGRRTP